MLTSKSWYHRFWCILTWFYCCQTGVFWSHLRHVLHSGVRDHDGSSRAQIHGFHVCGYPQLSKCDNWRPASLIKEYQWISSIDAVVLDCQVWFLGQTNHPKHKKCLLRVRGQGTRMGLHPLLQTTDKVGMQCNTDWLEVTSRCSNSYIGVSMFVAKQTFSKLQN